MPIVFYWFGLWLFYPSLFDLFLFQHNCLWRFGKLVRLVFLFFFLVLFPTLHSLRGIEHTVGLWLRVICFHRLFWIVVLILFDHFFLILLLFNSAAYNWYELKTSDTNLKSQVITRRPIQHLNPISCSLMPNETKPMATNELLFRLKISKSWYRVVKGKKACNRRNSNWKISYRLEILERCSAR